MTLSTTLPIISRFNPLSPCVPMTMRSTFSFFAR